MKNIIKKALLIAGFGTFLLSSCDKFLDVNENPSFPQSASAELLLPPIVWRMADGVGQDNRILFKFTQGMVGSSTSTISLYPERHGYSEASDLGGVLWRMVYVDHGKNLQDMIEDGIRNQKYEYVGIGYAIKAWGYQLLTDYHGPIILDEALTPGLLRFPYHDQKEVYAKVRVWGDSAIQYLQKVSPVDYSAKLNSTGGDNLYRGNKQRWIKFIHGLYALQYSHLVNKSDFPTHYADSVIKYVNLSFEGTADDALVKFRASRSEDSNPYGPQGGYLSSTYYGLVSDVIVKLLTGGMRGTPVELPRQKDVVDPRLSVMIQMKDDSTYVGSVINGGNANLNFTHANGKYEGSTRTGKYIFKDDAGFPIMTYSQLQFAKAEAYFLKGDKDNAHASYLEGIRAHFAFYNTHARAASTPDPVLSQADITAYLASADVAQTAADLKLSDIMGQKYIAQWGWAGVEQWCDIRKYHYSPTVFPMYNQLTGTGIFPNNGGKYAYRVRPRYNSEYIWNTLELDKWGALAPDYMTKELWFSTSEN